MTVGSQVDVVEAHVRDALARGATALTGDNRGHDGEPGHWFEPTVLVDVTHDMDCMREETFGPTHPEVADAEEAVRLANDSTYGLCAAIFSRDLKRAEGLARRIRTGAVTINDALINYAALELPMGGATPDSGIGHRHGPGGIRRYCRQQAARVAVPSAPRLPHAPLQRRADQALRAAVQAPLPTHIPMMRQLTRLDAQFLAIEDGRTHGQVGGLGIVLSAVGDERKKVGALDTGADDNVTKPFGARSCPRQQPGPARGDDGVLRRDDADDHHA